MLLKTGNKMDTAKLIDDISKEISGALKSMAQAKDVSDKEAYSRIVKNLCESLDVFLDLNRDMIPYDFDEFDDIDNEDLPF
jgi:hypothetical protein